MVLHTSKTLRVPIAQQRLFVDVLFKLGMAIGMAEKKGSLWAWHVLHSTGKQALLVNNIRLPHIDAGLV